ncbi:MAG: TasA family protein [Oscillospiraceae bacterium]
MRKRAKRRLILTSAAVLMIGAAAVGGMLAYLTDKDEVTNTFTVGEVKIDLTEPNYNLDNAKDIVPNQTITKDPTVTNTGKNDAIVFLKVTVPVKNVATANANGTLTEARTGTNLTPKNQELFTMNGSTAGANSQHKFNLAGTGTTGWIELTGQEQVSADGTTWNTFENYSEDGKYYYADTVNYRTYVFGYNAKLNPTEKTSALFDSVTFLNIVEGQITPGTELDIKVDAYAIQADCIDGVNTETLEQGNLSTIYTYYVNQNS